MIVVVVVVVAVIIVVIVICRYSKSPYGDSSYSKQSCSVAPLL